MATKAMRTSALCPFPGLGKPPVGRAGNNVVTPLTGLSGIRRQAEPPDPSSDLEKVTHLSKRVCDLWDQREFESYVKKVVMDSRDGKRQGLPWKVAQDLMFLLELSVAKRALIASEKTGVPFDDMVEICSAGFHNSAGGANPWSDPGTHNEVRQTGHDRPRPKARPVSRTQPKKNQGWLSRLFG